MKLHKVLILLLMLWVCIMTPSCITKVQVININNYKGTQDLTDIEFLLKGSDPKDSLNGNTLEALNGIPLYP